MAKISIDMLANALTAGLRTDREKAMRIFRWVQQNFKYDDNYSGPPRDLQQTFDTKKGICSELALVYIAVAKRAGIQADYVHVDINCHDERVCHACAEVTLYD